MPITFNLLTQGTRDTFGSASMPIVFDIDTAGFATLFGHSASQFVFLFNTLGYQFAWGCATGDDTGDGVVCGDTEAPVLVGVTAAGPDSASGVDWGAWAKGTSAANAKVTGNTNRKGC